MNSPLKIQPHFRQKFFYFFFFAFGMGSPWAFSQTITTVAGNGVPGFSGDGGPALLAKFSDIDGVAADAAGNFYLADSASQRIRRVDAATGIVTTFAGNGTYGFSGDGGPAAAAQFNDIDNVTLGDGDLYIVDTGNTRIRKVNGITGVVSTVAGNGVPSFSGDGGPATLASLQFPGGVALDPQRNIYIADTYNSRIRRVDAATGIITTVAGSAAYGYSGDGGLATFAKLHFPLGVAVDSRGNLLIADTSNHCVRKVDSTTGIITTAAGTGLQGYGGDSGPAIASQFYLPGGIILDAADNFFIADTGNHRVRKVVASTGVISTVAGTGVAYYSGDGGPAVLADLNSPSSVGTDGKGNLYIADDSNNRVRKVLALLVVATATPTATPIPVFTTTATPLPTMTVTPLATNTPTATFTPLCETRVWPDPFDPATAVGGVFKVDCIAPGGMVSFFTLSGERVIELREINGMVLWNGRNQKGILVVSGIYFYVVQRGEKVIQSGKFLVKSFRI